MPKKKKNQFFKIVKPALILKTMISKRDLIDDVTDIIKCELDNVDLNGNNILIVHRVLQFLVNSDDYRKSSDDDAMIEQCVKICLNINKDLNINEIKVQARFIIDQNIVNRFSTTFLTLVRIKHYIQKKLL